jgi:hypothetical protein
LRKLIFGENKSRYRRCFDRRGMAGERFRNEELKG